MDNKKTRKISVFTILIFALCVLLFGYVIMAFVSVTSYIKEMFGYGTITLPGNLFDIMSYYMTNCLVYLVYIAILLAIWWTRCKCGEGQESQDTTDEIKVFDSEGKPAIDKIDAADKEGTATEDKPAESITFPALDDKEPELEVKNPEVEEVSPEVDDKEDGKFTIDATDNKDDAESKVD